MILGKKGINYRLEIFIDKHKLLTDRQYCVRSNRSTPLALIESIDESTQAPHHKQYTVGTFTDLKKAFDRINPADLGSGL